MEKDNEFAKAQKWLDFSKTGTSDQALAFAYLVDQVKELFDSERPGVPLSAVEEFLEENHVTEDGVKAVGFETIPHFLFHLEEILEIRGKKINGRIIYFLFGKRSRRGSSLEKSDQGKNKVVGGVYHVNTSVADFHKILNLYRNVTVPLSTLTDYTLKVRGRKEKEQEKLSRKAREQKILAAAAKLKNEC